MKQPAADVLADGFSLEEYLQNEYPELRQL
jgi:hypothetical protein